MPPKPSEAEIEREVQRRLKERQELISSVVESAVEKLRPELNAIREEIADSNHIKAEFGDQLNDLVRAHIELPYHPGTAIFVAKIQEDEKLFGLEGLSMDEKRAVPSVVRTVLEIQKETKAEHQAKVDSASAATRRWQKVAALAAAIAAVMTLMGALGVFAFIRVHLFHLPA